MSSTPPLTVPALADGLGARPAVVIPILNNVFYPSVNKAFRPQLWVLLGIFILYAGASHSPTPTLTSHRSSALIILAGLVLRLIHGRLWIVHRIDGLVMIPNISVCYGLSASTYSIRALSPPPAERRG